MRIKNKSTRKVVPAVLQDRSNELNKEQSVNSQKSQNKRKTRPAPSLHDPAPKVTKKANTNLTPVPSSVTHAKGTAVSRVLAEVPTNEPNAALNVDFASASDDADDSEGRGELDSGDERDDTRAKQYLHDDTEEEGNSESEDDSNGKASSEDSEEDINLDNRQLRGIVVKDFHRENLRITKEKDKSEFRKQARRFGYLETTFPNNDEVTNGCVQTALEALGLPYNEDLRYRVDHRLRKMFRKAVSDSRSALVLSAADYLRDYDFDGMALRKRGVTIQRSRVQYHWLLNGSRFAREGFNDTGALMENPCLGHFIHQLFFNKQSSRKRLDYQQHVVTVPVLILTYTVMCFTMASGFGHKTVATKVNQEFSEKSEWRNTYFGMLNGPESRMVKWKNALEIQQNVVDSLEKSNSESNFCLADLLTVHTDSEGEMTDDE
ncbi:hypothetical protein BJV82DRAFT_629315 [Fennellomyces sp. T-0311]|nr:hypothetical protein BJV82DRAFT_637776 [Fennellomyces sp. T-0311]KAI8138722.1 hypothetical protein BJV82DRAFT_629315 [Fennellomyces sp. T-0311]